MEDYHHFVYHKLFDFKEDEVSLESFHKAITENIKSYLDDNTEDLEIQTNVLNHIISPLTVNWGTSCFKIETSMLPEDAEHIESAIKDEPMLYLINGMIEHSLCNQLALPKTILYNFYDSLKAYLRQSESTDFYKTQAYRLLKNLVTYGEHLFNKQFSYKDIDLVDMKAFLDINDELYRPENHDFVLINNSQLMIDDISDFKRLRIQLQFPLLPKEKYLNAFSITSVISNFHVMINAKEILILQSEGHESDNSNNIEVFQQEFAFDSAKIYTFVIECKDTMVKLFMEEALMSFSFYREQMEKLYIGKENTTNGCLKCFSINKLDSSSSGESDLLHLQMFKELNLESFNSDTAVLRCTSGEMLKRIYVHCDIFKKVLNFASKASPNLFFDHIYKVLINRREFLCSYSSEKEKGLLKSYVGSIFFMINEKIAEYDRKVEVFEYLLDSLVNASHEKHDQIYFKHCFSCISQWSHISELLFISLMNKIFGPSFNDSTSFEFELVEWIEDNIKLFDNFLDTLSKIDKSSSKLKKSIASTLQSIVDCILSAKNSSLLGHMMQKCLYYMEVNTTEGQFFSLQLVDAITKAIYHSDKQHIGRTFSPFVVDVAFLLINISSSKTNDLSVVLFEKSLLLYCVIVKSCPEIHAQFKVNGPLKLLGKAKNLHEDEKYDILNSFCKVICFSSFSFKEKEVLFLDYDLMTEGDVLIFKSFEREYTEFHLLLIKTFTITDCTKLPFFLRYLEIVDTLLESESYRKQVFANECRVMVSLITLAMISNEIDLNRIKKILVKLFKLSMIYLPNESFNKLCVVMNSENYENNQRNFAGAYKKWVIFNIFPDLLEELVEVHSILVLDSSIYLDNFKTLLQFIGSAFTLYEMVSKMLLDLTLMVFTLLYDTSESKYYSVAAKLLSLVCLHSNVKNDEVARLVISNQHIILTEESFTVYFIQIFEFIVLNYITTTENKDEKFAFIRLQMSTIENSYKSGFLSSFPIFTGRDFPIKNLLNKMNKLDNSEIKKMLLENEGEFSLKLLKKSNIYDLQSPNFETDLRIKADTLEADSLVAKQCFESFTSSLVTVLDHIMMSESKNLQIRSIDNDDEAEASRRYLDECDYYMFKIKNAHETLNNQDEVYRLALHRSTNSLMQRKIFAPNKLVKDKQKPQSTESHTTEYTTKSTTGLHSSNISQNSRVIKKLALNESIKHIWNTCIIVGVNIENGVLILTDKNVLFYNQYFYRESEGAIIKRNEMTAEEEKSLVALTFEESYSKNKGDLEPETFISVPKCDILYSLKRVFLFKDIACEFSDKNNYSYFFTFANKLMRDSFYNETNTSLVFTSLNHDMSKSSNVFEKIFEGINIESSEIINKNGIGAFSFTSKLTSVFHSLVSEDYKLEKITSEWAAGKISNFFYLLAINFYAGRSFNDITQYPVFPWVISNYSSDELDLDDGNNFRDLSKPMGAQTESRMEQFIERYKSMQELEDERSPPFHYGTHYSSAMIVASYLIRIEPYTTSFKILQGGSFGPPDRLFNSIERSWVSASKELSTDVRELIPEFYFLPEFLENINNIDFGVLQSGDSVGNVHLPQWCNGSTTSFVLKNLEALESDYVSEHLHHWIDLMFGYKQRGEEAVNAVNVFNQLSYSGYTSIKDSVFDDFNLTTSVIHNFGQIPLQLFNSTHPQRATPHFNRGMISVSKDSKQVLNCCHYFNEMYVDYEKKHGLEFVLNDDSSIFTNVLGGMISLDKEKNTHKHLHGHYNSIKKLVYLKNYNMLMTLDEHGKCLKWLITEHELIGNLKNGMNFVDIWGSDNSGNLIVKKEDSDLYDLINVNGTLLEKDILGGISFGKILGFAVISNELKVAFSDMIDYLLTYDNGKIEIYELVVSSKGKFELKKCLVDIEFDITDVTTLQGHLDRDIKNKSHLAIKIQYQKRDSHGYLNYEL